MFIAKEILLFQFQLILDPVVTTDKSDLIQLFFLVFMVIRLFYAFRFLAALAVLHIFNTYHTCATASGAIIHLQLRCILNEYMQMNNMHDKFLMDHLCPISWGCLAVD